MKRVLAIGLSLALAIVSIGATTPNTAILLQTPNRGIVQFLQGTDAAGTYKTLYTSGANGSRCIGGYITTNDAVSHLLTFQVVNSAVKYGGIAIATGTTTPGFAAAVPPISVTIGTTWPGLPIDSDGNPYLQLISGDTLQVTFATALTSTDVINVVITCGDF